MATATIERNSARDSSVHRLFRREPSLRSENQAEGSLPGDDPTSGAKITCLVVVIFVATAVFVTPSACYYVREEVSKQSTLQLL